MAKTRSQTGSIAIKKEEQDVKPTLALNGVTNRRTSSRIAKQRPPVTNNRILSAQQVKVEEGTNTKPLLQLSPKPSKLPKGQKISQDQINQVISYIVNDNMSIAKASQKAKMSERSGSNYYHLYMDDPEKRMPLPRTQQMYTARICTQEQIGNLVRYIDTDKMTVKEASAKANMSYHCAYYRYSRYLKGLNYDASTRRYCQYYTHDQKSKFVGYVINDKMSITAASKKAKMNRETAKRYLRKYIKVQNPDIPTPSHVRMVTRYTQEQIEEVIRYIADDKMSIKAASRKANFCPMSAGKYYRQYLIDNNTEVPISKTSKRYTQNEKNELIRYVVDDKMTIKAASKKANIRYNTGKRYYRKYLQDHHLEVPTPKVITQDQKSELVGYIVHDNMSINAAAKKANMSSSAGRVYYHQYLKDRNIDVPIQKHITQEQQSKLIGYIVDNKMSIRAAAIKVNIAKSTGQKYYNQYRENQKGNGPIRRPQVVPAPKNE